MTTYIIQQVARRLHSLLIIFAVGVGVNFSMAGQAMAATQAQISKENEISGVQISQATEINNWVVVNDTVMGGRSQANIIFADDHMQFLGNLSMRNNGGFASIRRIYEPVNWQANKTMQIVVRGDGRNYQFRLRTNRYMDGVAYVKAFSTVKGEWQTITFTEKDFTAQFRGRLIRNAKDLTFPDITQLGFVLADGQPGGFELHVKEISQLD
jgi:NADH dehydrogenase [ubiquinone] 1 alpha subcomplex assembly factor 1